MKINIEELLEELTFADEVVLEIVEEVELT